MQFTIVSDVTDWIIGTYLPNGGDAVLSIIPSEFTAKIPGANWIWSIYYSPSVSYSNIYKSFFIAGSPTSATFYIAVDDSHTVKINEKSFGCDLPSHSYTLETQKTCDATSVVQPGLNTLVIEALCNGYNGGVLYKLVVNIALNN